jgi:hypothetical protein
VTKVVILAPANNGMDFESIFVAHIASDRGVYRVVVFRWTQSISKFSEMTPDILKTGYADDCVFGDMLLLFGFDSI